LERYRIRGKGTLNSKINFLTTPYSFNSRFENADGTQGTNPEELLAAARRMFCGIEFCCHSNWFYSRIFYVEAKVALDAVDDG
jgi:osmotically inducible protein OsmC